MWSNRLTWTFSPFRRLTTFGRRSFSGGGGETESGFQKGLRLLAKNKQAIINTIGVYIVLSYSVHNYRVQQAWDKREEEFKALKEEVDFMKRTLQNPDWLSETEKSVRANARSSSSVLGTMIEQALKLRTEQEIVEHKQKTGEGVEVVRKDLGGLDQLAALVDGRNGHVKQDKASSKNGVDIKIV